MAKIPTVTSQQGIGSASFSGAGSADVSVGVPSTGGVSYTPLDAVSQVSGDAVPSFSREAANTINAAISTIAGDLKAKADARVEYEENMWVAKVTSDVGKTWAEDYSNEQNNPELGSLDRFQVKLDEAIAAIDESAPSDTARYKATAVVMREGLQQQERYLALESNKKINARNAVITDVMATANDTIRLSEGDPKVMYEQQAKIESMLKASEDANALPPQDIARHRFLNQQLAVSNAEYLIGQGRTTEAMAIVKNAKGISIEQQTALERQVESTLKQQKHNMVRGTEDAWAAKVDMVEKFGKSGIQLTKEQVSSVLGPEQAEEYGKDVQAASVVFLARSDMKGKSQAEIASIVKKYEPTGASDSAEWVRQNKTYEKIYKAGAEQAEMVRQTPVIAVQDADPRTAQAYKEFAAAGASGLSTKDQYKLWLNYSSKVKYAQDKIGVPSHKVALLPENVAPVIAEQLNHTTGKALKDRLVQMQEQYGADYKAVIRQMENLPEGQRLNKGLALAGDLHTNKEWFTALAEATAVPDDTYRKAIGESSMSAIKKKVRSQDAYVKYSSTLAKSKGLTGASQMSAEVATMIDSYAFSLRMTGKDDAAAAKLATDRVLGEEFAFVKNSSDYSEVFLRKTYYTAQGKELRRTDAELKLMERGMAVLVGDAKPKDIRSPKDRPQDPGRIYGGMSVSGRTDEFSRLPNHALTAKDLHPSEFVTDLPGYGLPSTPGSLWTADQLSDYSDKVMRTVFFWAPTPTGVMLMRPDVQGTASRPVLGANGKPIEYTQDELMAAAVITGNQ